MKERRVLIIDDSLTIRRLAERVLRQEGFLTETAESIAEASARLPLFQPDAVLLDYILPDGYGTDACRTLLEDEKTASIPVILISAKGGDIRQLYIDLPNVVDFVTKPFTPAVLVSVVSHVLHTRRDGRPGTPPGGSARGRAVDDAERRHAPMAASRAALAAIAELAASGGAVGGGVDAAGDVLLSGWTRLLPLDRVLEACQRDGGLVRLDARDAPGVTLSLWVDCGRLVWARAATASLEHPQVRDHLAGVAVPVPRDGEGGDGSSADTWIAEQVRAGRLERGAAQAAIRAVAIEEFLDCSDAESVPFAVTRAPALPTEAEGLQIDLGLDEVRMARLRRADAWHVIEGVIPSLDAVLVRTQDAPRMAARLGLLGEESRLLEQVDGDRSVREIVAANGLTTFAGCRVLYRLVESGLVRVKQRRGEGDGGGVHRVLVVDSDPERLYPAVVEALAELDAGIEVRCHAESATRIPYAIRLFQPDALLLDVRLAGFDAVKLVKLLRQSAEFHAMLIVATGDDLSTDEVRHLYRVGCSRVLPKPFLGDELHAAMGGDHAVVAGIEEGWEERR